MNFNRIQVAAVAAAVTFTVVIIVELPRGWARPLLAAIVSFFCGVVFAEGGRKKEV